ncbi:hypothetical protein [Stenotrophomonas maltophilia]|uniref:hypothetical protein n=1 Tax=Stenotrophomonas maltophilia TaxID=40324 RepID=UPI0013DBB896|nr:hypothetical protein [Stenotrophomonas maltophilia]MBN4981096.1 hypothetical protein [Stenotrophomonas maltophilia]NRP01087.1 hypothetical protein [Stenotrophomonas maltophilia]
MSNQTKAALHILQWMSDMEGRVDGCDGAINVAKAWEERELQKKAQAYKRLVKAVNCIPALSPRERMSKFVAYGLRGGRSQAAGKAQERGGGIGVALDGRGPAQRRGS